MNLRNLFASFFGKPVSSSQGTDPLNYENLIHLDAEELSENGMVEAYNKVLPSLSQFVPRPATVEELIDNSIPSYVVLADGVRYDICSPDSQEHCWVSASLAFFDIVNRQLADLPYRFYAFYSDNDLSGMFLTEAEYTAAIHGIKDKSSWPYLLTNEPPWYGRAH